MIPATETSNKTSSEKVNMKGGDESHEKLIQYLYNPDFRNIRNMSPTTGATRTVS